MIFSVVYLVVRCLLGCQMVLARRAASKDAELLVVLCVPITSSMSCDQVILVDQASDASPSSDAVQVEVDRLG